MFCITTVMTGHKVNIQMELINTVTYKTTSVSMIYQARNLSVIRGDLVHKLYECMYNFCDEVEDNLLKSFVDSSSNGVVTYPLLKSSYGKDIRQIRCLLKTHIYWDPINLSNIKDKVKEWNRVL